MRSELDLENSWLKYVADCADKLGSGATTAADETGAGLDERWDVLGEMLRRLGVDGLSVDHLRQARIRLDPNRPVSGRTQCGAYGHESLNTLAAVGADHIRTCGGQFERAVLNSLAHDRPIALFA